MIRTTVPIKQEDYSSIESIEYVELETEDSKLGNFGKLGMIMAYVSDNQFINGIGIGHWAVIVSRLITNESDLDEIGNKFDEISNEYLTNKCVYTQYQYGNQVYIFRTKRVSKFDLLRMGKDGALVKKLEDGREQIFIEGPIERMEMLANKLIKDYQKSKADPSPKSLERSRSL